MRSFAETRWAPPGSRPHVHIAASVRVAELARACLEQAARWWVEQGDGRGWAAVFGALPAQYLHLTLAWVDRPTSTLTAGELTALRHAVATQVSAVAPLEIQVGPVWVGTYAVELYVAATPDLDAVAGAVRTAIRGVLGTPAQPEPPAPRPWRPHITLGYGRASFDSETLASGLAYTPNPHGPGLITPITMPVTSLIQVDQDTYAPDGLRWDPVTAHFLNDDTPLSAD